MVAWLVETTVLRKVELWDYKKAYCLGQEKASQRERMKAKESANTMEIQKEMEKEAQKVVEKGKLKVVGWAQDRRWVCKLLVRQKVLARVLMWDHY